MAIEKTLFTGADLDTRKTEVYNWLTTNATEYFSQITTDDNNQIVCTIANGGSVAFGYGSSSSSGIYQYNGIITLANGTSYKSSYTSNLSYKHTYAVKMDNGIYLYAYSSYNTAYNSCVLISKTNDGAVVISALLSSHGSILCPEKDVVYQSDQDLKAVRTDNTVFCPIVVGENSYTENMLYMPFKQHVTFVGTMTDAEGQKYWYDGTCALKYEE